MLPIALLLAAAAATSDTALMRPGVSLDLARLRAEQIADVRYDLHLSLLGRDTAAGRVTILFTARGAGDVIVDFRGPWLGAVKVNGTTAEHVEWNGHHVRIPEALLRPGDNRLEMQFAARIAPAGASIIRYRDATDGSDYLYTLLVPSDAHALFPSFDQPDLKARLTLALEIPPEWNAIANGVPVRTALALRSKIVHFRETEPLSTYLFAFAAGPWTRFTGGYKQTGLLARASRASEVEVDSLQAQIGGGLKMLEEYFGVPYPFQQFQSLLSPAFPFGGMEHPGVTMFNEETFIYREPPTLTQRLGRRATIYHEVAHMWFGDYVTMRWFDDLWLKEGFATYMAAKMQEMEGLPNPWMTFYLRNKPSAYGVDATIGTTPVWQELGNLDQAKSNYGAIVYNKAPGILKQLEYLVGDSAFRAGVHRHLMRHAYGSATWRDLLDDIGFAAGQSLDEWGRHYILRPGMPVIEQHLDLDDHGNVRRLLLVQRAAQPEVSGHGTWPMRTELLLRFPNGVVEHVALEIRTDTTEVTAARGRPAPDLVFANANDRAYALVHLDDRSAAWVERNAGTVADPLERALLWGSLWDLVRDARFAPARYATAVLRELPAEREEQIASVLLGRLARAVESYLSPAQRAALLPEVERVLLAGAADTTQSYGFRKSRLDTYIALAGTEGGMARLDAWLDSASTAGLPLQQPTRWAIVTRLLGTGARAAEDRMLAEARRDTTTGAARRMFIAGAARPDVASKRDYFERYFADTTLNEEWATASLRAFHDPAQAELTLPYLTPSLDSLLWIQQNRRIFYLGSWLAAVMNGQQSPEALAIVDAYLADHPSLPLDMRQKILQARDDLERAVRIRALFGE